eukprot:COSAG04_NODE_2934_length_3374_cov_1.368855_3_plen_376_part_00
MAGSSWLFRVLQGIIVCTTLWMWLSLDDFAREGAGMAEANVLMTMGFTSLACGWFMLLFPLDGSRTAIVPGGALEALGVGTARISIEDEKRLRRVRMVLGALSAFLFMVGIFFFVASVAMPDTGDVTARLLFVGAGLTSVTVYPIVFTGFLGSMHTASCLCRNVVITQIRTVQFADLVNDGTKRKEVLALQHTVKLLSEGWGRGLLGFFGMCWGISLGCFLLAINDPYVAGMDEKLLGGLMPDGTWRALYLMLSTNYSFLPVLATIDVATTSSCCDLLMDEINQARQRLGPEANEVITWLESSLKNLVRLPPSRAAFLFFFCSGDARTRWLAESRARTRLCDGRNGRRPQDAGPRDGFHHHQHVLCHYLHLRLHG